MKEFDECLRLTRRGFLAAAATAATVGKARGAGSEFAFAALGDVHFDRPEHHDMEWLSRDHPGDVAQVDNYSRITREVTPALFGALRRRAADPSAGAPLAFVAQLGDLVEGMCGSPTLALRQCEEAAAFVRGSDLGVPFYMTKGNHEIQGPGAVEAFDRALRPALCGPLGPGRGPASYTISRGPALFAFLDAYDPGALDWLARTLGARPAAARHVFVLLHPPVVPFGARSTWHLYSKPTEATRRHRLLGLLGEHRAIVLSAHLHKYGLVVRETGSGRFVQLALASVLPRAEIRPRDEVSGVDRYGPDLVSVEPNFSPATEEARREALRAEAPSVSRFEYADVPGYAVLDVREESVTAAVHAGLAPEPWRTLDLTGLLGRT